MGFVKAAALAVPSGDSVTLWKRSFFGFFPVWRSNWTSFDSPVVLWFTPAELLLQQSLARVEKRSLCFEKQPWKWSSKSNIFSSTCCFGYRFWPKGRLHRKKAMPARVIKTKMDLLPFKLRLECKWTLPTKFPAPAARQPLIVCTPNSYIYNYTPTAVPSATPHAEIEMAYYDLWPRCRIWNKFLNLVPIVLHPPRYCFFSFLLTLLILQAKKAKSKHTFDHVDVAVLASVLRNE